MKKELWSRAETFDSVNGQSTNKSWVLVDLEETIALGKELGQRLPNLTLLLLNGPLGAGKTSLIKGLAKSFGIQEPINSPSFALSQHYTEGNPPLIHIDLYRLENQKEANEIFLQEEEVANEIGAVIAIEWAERLGLFLPEAWKINLEYLPSPGRKVSLIYPT